MEEKLLILGIDTTTRLIINEARKKKIYTILTDYNPIDKVPLKKCVDEAWTINVGAIDELEQKCIETGVTAVMAGNHEFCLDSARKLALRLNLPFYANDFCWSVARNKVLFKKLCTECAINVPGNYSIDQPVSYPVCVKPSDSNGSRGVSFVYHKKDLQAAYENALTFSENDKIIIEQMLTGRELVIIGYADQGDYHLLCVGKSYPVIFAGKNVLLWDSTLLKSLPGSSKSTLLI